VNTRPARSEGAWRARLSYDPGRRVVSIERPGLPTGELPLPAPDVPVRLLLDADIVEIFTAKSYGAYRIGPAVDPAATTLRLAGPGAAAATVRPLTT
jgi:hypothetical protein